jgi:hypothetical protein
MAAQLVLGAALLIAVIGWHDPDPTLRVQVPLLGAAGLLAGLGALRVARFRWLLVATDIWFVIFGLLLSASLSATSRTADHWDPAPAELAHLLRMQGWFEPAVQRPVTAAFLIAGTIGALAVARRSDRPG